MKIPLLKVIQKIGRPDEVLIKGPSGHEKKQVDDILSQSTDDLLNDLNLDEATESRILDDYDRSVNDYALAVIIKRLHRDSVALRAMMDDAERLPDWWRINEPRAVEGK